MTLASSTGPSSTGALIVGAGPGLSASFARLLARRGHAVALAARDVGKLAALAAETGAALHACDASDPAAVAALFDAAGSPGIVLCNASSRVRGPLTELDPDTIAATAAVMDQPRSAWTDEITGRPWVGRF